MRYWNGEASPPIRLDACQASRRTIGRGGGEHDTRRVKPLRAEKSIATFDWMQSFDQVEIRNQSRDLDSL